MYDYLTKQNAKKVWLTNHVHITNCFNSEFQT